MQELSLLGADLLGDTLTGLDAITPRPQDTADATFAPMLKKEDGLIDWSNSAVAIERAVRGFQRWPNAYTHYKSSRLVIWSADPIEAEISDTVGGEVITAHGDELIVKCGTRTALRLIEIQPEAKRRMSAREFLNGKHINIGDRLE
jgi:methionyl-tRNA formyltransferase